MSAAVSWQKIIAAEPTWEPVSVDEARAHCRVDIHDDDALLSGLITAARQYVESVGWRIIPQQTVDLWLAAFPVGAEIQLPYPPLQSVTHIKYYSTADAESTLATTVYAVDAISTPGRVVLKYNQTWPSAILRDYNAVNVRYVAGYTAPDSVPRPIKQAILLLVGHWYENRESAITGTISRVIDFGVQALIHADRPFKF